MILRYTAPPRCPDGAISQEYTEILALLSCVPYPHTPPLDRSGKQESPASPGLLPPFPLSSSPLPRLGTLPLFKLAFGDSPQSNPTSTGVPTADAISIVLDDDVLSEDIDFLRYSDREGNNRGGGGGGGGGGGARAGGAGGGSGYAYAENGRTRRAPGWRRDE